MFTLKNFETYIDAKILARGQEYYENGSVGRLEKFGDGDYVAMVRGTSQYNVGVKLVKDEIEKWECDCPYDWGVICKHTVAVIFSIRDGDYNSGKSVVSDDLRKALIEISDEQLRDFTIRQLKQNWNFRKEFLLEFVEGFELDEEDEYWEDY